MRLASVRAHSRMTKDGRVAVRAHKRRYEPALPRDYPFKSKKGVFALEKRTAVIVPSTTTKDRKIPRKEFEKRVEETRRFLSNTNGGYTSLRAQGGYVARDGGLIKEPVVVVESYATEEDYIKNRSRVESWLKRKGAEWGQESVGYEYEDDLFYVDTDR